MKSQWMLGTVFAVCTVAGGCGDSKGEGSDGDGKGKGQGVVIETELSLTKKISELSAAERDLFCKQTTAAEDTAIGATQERYCAFAAQFSEDPKSCQKDYDACLDEKHDVVGKHWTANDYKQGVDCEFPVDCDATLAELKECYEWELSIERDFYEGFSCGEPEPAYPEDASELPEECKALAEKCPDAFEFDDE